MGTDFAPYLQHVIPPLLAAAAVMPRITVDDAEDPNAPDPEGMTTFVVDDKVRGAQ